VCTQVSRLDTPDIGGVVAAPISVENESTEITPTPSIDSDDVCLDSTPSARTSAWRRQLDDRHSGTLGLARQPHAWLDPMVVSNSTRFAASLPWTPKVRQTDVLSFLNSARDKFLNLYLSDDDATTEIGLPAPIRRSVNTIRSHVYHSLSEKQVRVVWNF
jgi:hypothetical protein